MTVSYARVGFVSLAAAGIAAAVLMLWWGDRAPAPVTATEHAAEAKAGASVHAGARPELTGGGATGVPDEPSALEDDDSDNPLAGDIRKILANDAQLNTFMYYHRRPLLDDAALAAYHKFLADPAVLAAMKHDLLYPEEARPDQASNIKRLMKIDYLRAALEWKDNPSRETVIAATSEIITTDNYPAGMAADMKLSLSGNKMELFQLLSETAPQQLASVIVATKGTRLEPLIGHIIKSDEARKAAEAQLANEVKPPRTPKP